MRIGSREIGAGEPPYVIAEIGVNHDGEVARALELTDAAADAGADAVKLQYFETDRLMSKAAKLAAYQKAAGETDPVAMLRRLELTHDEMAMVVDRAHERGIHAIVTVFSVELVKPAAELAWDAFKSASPDVVNRPLLEALAVEGKPLIVSTGASELEEVVRARGWLDAIEDRLAFLQCVSSYPVRQEDAALGGIDVLRRRLDLPVGYSDHTVQIGTGAHAVGCGAFILEKHLTYDRWSAGPDHQASLEPDQLGEYVRLTASRPSYEPVGREHVTSTIQTDLVHLIQTQQADPSLTALLDSGAQEFLVLWGENEESAAPDRDRPPLRAYELDKRVLDCERDVREVSRQSVVTTRAFSPGDTITRNDLTIKRPGTGIEPWRIDEIVGRTVARETEADTPIVEQDLD